MGIKIHGNKLDGDDCNQVVINGVDVMAELSTIRAENERLREVVQGAIRLLDDLFQPGDYAPGVTLFCENAKEALK